jgi:hypothetical protein
MRIEVSKKVFLGMLVAVLVVVGVFWVVAYNSSPANPASMGHSVNEIDWSKMIDSSVFVKNNVGIGTSTPEARLHINGTGFAGLFVENSGQTYSFYVHDNGNLVIGDENAEAARISVDSTGNVSVGNYLKASGLCIGSDCITAWPSAESGSQWTTSGNNIYYNSGNVGIGTVSPSESLSVNGNVSASNYLKAGGLCIAGNCTSNIKAVPVYKFNKYCGSGEITFTLTCATAHTCQYYTGGVYVVRYFNCDGSCDGGGSSPHNCPNTLVGYLVN